MTAARGTEPILPQTLAPGNGVSSTRHPEEVPMATTGERTRHTAPGARLRTARIGIAQVAPRLGDLAANVQQHLETIEAARAQKSDLVLFPELSTAGYQLKDLVPDVALDGRSKHLHDLVAASRGLALGFGFVEESADHRFYNSYAFCEDGRLVHVHRKVYLPTYGLFEEGRLYAAGGKNAKPMQSAEISARKDAPPSAQSCSRKPIPKIKR